MVNADKDKASKDEPNWDKVPVITDTQSYYLIAIEAIQNEIKERPTVNLFTEVTERTTGTTSPALKELEDLKLIKRRKIGREVTQKLTPLGKHAIQKWIRDNDAEEDYKELFKKHAEKIRELQGKI
ncbi:MAG: hypothetical protein ACFFD4_12895 [Candidatus Odinarchaeota archaeon]